MPEITETRLANWLSLAPGATQVLVCDLQVEIVARSKTTDPQALAGSAAVLCGVAGALGIPVTFSVVPEGDKPPQLIPELAEFASGENQFGRANVNPFLNAEFVAHLAAGNRRTLVLAGFATEAVVLHTAISALERGFLPVVALDACGGMSQATEGAAFGQIRDCGGIVSSVTSIATALAPDFTTEAGKRTFRIVQKLRLA